MFVELHKRVLADHRQKVTEVADKWTAIIKQMAPPQLHDGGFLERARRSAAYFEKTLAELYTRPLEQGRTAIKSLCPPEITFEEINLVLGAMEP